jgi:hypothetical protein
MSQLPTISYKEFLKNPVIGILFLSLFAITYLYIDNKSNYKNIIAKQEIRIDKLEGDVERLQNDITKRDSLIIVINSKLNRLNEK